MDMIRLGVDSGTPYFIDVNTANIESVISLNDNAADARATVRLRSGSSFKVFGTREDITEMIVNPALHVHPRP